MKKDNLDLLGLTDGATKEEIQAAYDTLRAKYLEDRFLDGEAGNNAAKMLTKIEVAYNELLAELAESDSSEDIGGGSAYEKVEQLIKQNNIQEAQRALDAFNERGAQWHYLQSVVFYRKNWINESKKQLEIAMQLDAGNQKYKDAYRKLNERIEHSASAAQNGSVYQGQTMNSTPQDDQMGGNFCSQCITCCYINLCVNCLCNMCCH
jgi:hypothetical protein